MKTFILAAIVFCSAGASAEEPLNCSDRALSDRAACIVGYKVIQGLLISQDQGLFPKEIDLQKLHRALNAGEVYLERGSFFSESSLEKKGNLVYRSMMNSTKQTLPPLNSNSILERGQNLPRDTQLVSTGTRGGGDDLSTTLLPLNLWF